MRPNVVRLLLSVAILFAPIAAKAQQCGSTIYASVSLRADLVCPPGSDGLIVGADNLRIDLNGFSILGGATLGTTGISSTGFSGIKVVGPGRIAGFEVSVNVADGRYHEIREVDIADAVSRWPSSSGLALWMRSMRDSTVEKSRIGRMILDATASGVATGNRISGNDAEYIALVGFEVCGNDVVGNDIHAVDTAAVLVNAGSGNRILGNSMTGHVDLASATKTQVEDNTIQAPRSGWTAWSGVVLGDYYWYQGSGYARMPARDNFIRGNRIYGGAFGITMTAGATRNTVAGNKIDGARVGFFFHQGAEDNDARGNWLNVLVPGYDLGRGNLWP